MAISFSADRMVKKITLPQQSHSIASTMLWLTVLALSLIKMRTYLPHGRFWAEEGRYFYHDIANSPGISGLFYLFNHHLELATNFVVFISGLTDLYHAPLITTLLSFSIQLLPIGFLIHQRSQIGLGDFRTGIFILAACSIPQSQEVWANSINLHFHFALLAFLILITPCNSRLQRNSFRFLLLLCGLSGIPANVMTPFFIFTALKDKDPEKRIQAGILVLTSTLQIAILASHGLPQDRQTLTSPQLIWLAVLAQDFISPWLDKHLAKPLISELGLFETNPVSSNLVALLLSGIILILLGYLHRQNKSKTLLCYVAAISLSIFCVAESIGDKKDLISMQGGGRYFYASNMILLLGVLLAIPSKLGRFAQTASIIWILTLIPGIKKTYSGPDWQQAYRQAIESNATVINIWPSGWSMEYTVQ